MTNELDIDECEGCGYLAVEGAELVQARCGKVFCVDCAASHGDCPYCAQERALEYADEIFARRKGK